jgi:hypothetical protein
LWLFRKGFQSLKSIFQIIIGIICYYGIPIFGFIYLVPRLLRLIDPKVSQIQATKYFYFDLFRYNIWLGIFATFMCIICLLVGVILTKRVAK